MPVVPAAARKAAGESLPSRIRRAKKVVQTLRRTYPEADCALRHRSSWQLLVATILSAQCTDTRVNKVTPALFRKYRSVKDFAEADLTDLETLIRSTGFFRSKARSIREAARQILTQHSGRVPSDMDALSALPGVGQKTAHVVRGTWFDLPAITVDTHVGRLSRRLGLTRENDPVKVERDLEKVFPEDVRTFTSHALIWHGRQACHARTPDCGHCSMARFCPSASLF